MIEHLLSDPRYIKARTEGRWHYWGHRPEIPLIAWEPILENIGFSMVRQGELRMLANGGMVGYHGQRIPAVRSIMNEISASAPEWSPSAHVFVSMAETSAGYGRHEDDSDLWYWQVQGKTQWRVEHESGNFEAVLEPGHWLYVHRHLYHTVKPLGARASLSFASHYTIPNNSIKLF